MRQRAAIYTRVSTEKQLREGHGLESQEEKCKKLIDFKEWFYYKTYQDKAISGTVDNLQREGMSEMLQDAQDGKIDIVVIYKLDRLGRTATIVVETVKYIVDKLELRLVSCCEDLDTSKPSGRLVLTMFAGIAEYEKDIITERLEMGREHVLKTRGETGGLLNYGYVREEGKKIGVSLKKADIVKQVIYDYEDGVNIKQISRNLNGANIPAPKGEIWHASAVRKILSNREKYEGCIRSGKNELNERWPIIYKDDFESSKYLSQEEDIKKVMKKTVRTAVYIRIANIANKSYKSLQEEKIREYIKEKNLFLTKTYYDISPSFNFDKRENLEKLFQDHKKFSILLVYRLNILGHNEEILERICDLLEEYDIKLISITGF